MNIYKFETNKLSMETFISSATTWYTTGLRFKVNAGNDDYLRFLMKEICPVMNQSHGRLIMIKKGTYNSIILLLQGLIGYNVVTNTFNPSLNYTSFMIEAIARYSPDQIGELSQYDLYLMYE